MMNPSKLSEDYVSFPQAADKIEECFVDALAGRKLPLAQTLNCCFNEFLVQIDKFPRELNDVVLVDFFQQRNAAAPKRPIQRLFRDFFATERSFG